MCPHFVVLSIHQNKIFILAFKKNYKNALILIILLGALPVCHFPKNTKRRRRPRPDQSLLPLPVSFSPRQWYWRYPISRIVLTRSEVRSCYTPRPMWGSACSGGVTLASLFWRTCASSSHRIAGYYRSRECVEASQTVLPSFPSNRPFVVVIAYEDFKK